MNEKHSKMEQEFSNMDRTIKIGDLAAIVSQLLDIPIPFVNLGVIHPIFSPSSDLKTVHKQMMHNLI